MVAMSMTDEACIRHGLRLQHRLSDCAANAGARRWLCVVQRELLGMAVTEELLGRLEHCCGQPST